MVRAVLDRVLETGEPKTFLGKKNAEKKEGKLRDIILAGRLWV